MRRFLGNRIISLATAALVATTTVGAANDERHGLSLLGDLKYGPDFKYFDYVNPNAPKGGKLRISAIGGFDSLNPFIIKGRSAALIGYTYDTLMESARDEASTEYGLMAESVSHPPDYSSVTYTLRKEARWHDGKPITPEDVIFSLDALKEGLPTFRYYYANVIKVEKTGDRKVTFTFNQKGNRELPQIVGQMTVIPKHYWEGTDASGKQRDFLATTLEPPLGSGPYRIKTVDTGRSITVERVGDYWGKDLPVNVGRYNFDEITAEYFRDNTIALEAFKGDQFDVIVESSAKNWATAYTFRAAERGDVITDVFTNRNAEPMQAFVFNTRREKFADPRVRLAFNYAFDFESANRLLFFDQYSRVDSYFANSGLAATGLPEGKELEILESVRDKIPPEVFTRVYKNPVGGDQRALRKNLREARKLLEQAGWTIEDGKLVNTRTGERMTAEFLLVSPSFERIVLPYKQNLGRLGIDVSVRTIDTSQYQNRRDSFDFDVIVGSWGQSLSPGNEQRNYWGSQSADRNGSRNLIGVRNPAVDTLIERIIYAKSRDELVAASKALDRVLLWNHYVVPQWFFRGIRLARWNRFGFPDKQPDYGYSYPDTWWFDPKKAATIKGAE